MSKKYYGLVLALMASLPGYALANDFYLGAEGGVNFQNDSDLRGTGINTEAEFDTGWAVGGTAGYYWDLPNGHDVRTELELLYRQNDIDTIRGAAAGTSAGRVDSWSLMGNAVYDIRNTTPVTPYLGVGAGATWVNFDDVRPVGTTRIDDRKTAFAVQGIAGASYRVTDMVDVYADYRYQTTFDEKIKTVAGSKVEFDNNNNTVLLGVRFNFGAPQPAPAPAPVTEKRPPVVAMEPRSYLVFFDFDRADITPEGRNIITNAVKNYKQGGATRVEITGHADRSGADSYNMGLSQRRADAVKREFVKMGVAEKDIATSAKGESEPLVPTADGMREPQNRRVQIVYTGSKTTR